MIRIPPPADYFFSFPSFSRGVTPRAEPLCEICFFPSTENEPGGFIFIKIDFFLSENFENFPPQKNIPDLLHLDIWVFGVADHEFHSPRAAGEAENRLYGPPTGRTDRYSHLRMSGNSNPFRARADWVDFWALLRPWDYEIRDQRPLIIIIPNGEGLGRFFFF